MRKNFFSSFVWGIIIILLGFGALMDSANILDFGTIFRTYWPVILLVIGLADLLEKRYYNALFWIGFGVLFGLESLGKIDVNVWSLIFPVIIIIIGLKVLRRAFVVTEKNHENVVSGVSVFGGAEKKIASKDFKSADMTAIFGGTKLDMREAKISSEGALIDAFMLFGGGEIVVSENVPVKIDVVSIFGGTEDKRSMSKIDEKAPHIRIQGIVIFGGLEIKN